MESFLDDYQTVRLFMIFGGFVLMPVQLLLAGWDARVLPIALALLAVGAHALWCRARRIRTPRVMVALDLTVWGSVMLLLSEQPAVITATLAFLTLVAVLFSSGWWTGGFLAYLASWYGAASFIGRGFEGEAVSNFASVLLTVGGVALVMWRVKGWLGRLDANRSQMLGTVSHELKNSLTGMIGMTELVSTEQVAPEEVRELVELAHMQAVEASEIVDDLLTSTSLERAALSVQMAPVDLNEETLTTARRFAGEGVLITLHLADDLSAAVGDSLRVRQVLRNLLSNAVRYGGSNVSISTFGEGPWLRIVVSDDGDGVPPEDEKTIFLPYRRSMATRRAAMSVGLGLWISHQLALAMGGDLQYQRTDGMTEFVFSLRKDGIDDRRPAGAASKSEAARAELTLSSLAGRSANVEYRRISLGVHA